MPSSYTDYRSKLVSSGQFSTQLISTKDNFTVTAGRLNSLWLATPNAGIAPTVAAVPGNTTAGSLRQFEANAGKILRFGTVKVNSQGWGVYQLCDRLSHQGGLNATLTTAQTTNLPTAAITRGSAVGVLIGLEIYTAIGATATFVNVSYTNSAGVAGRTTPSTTFGGTGFREAGRMIVLPLQDGDVGVQSVQSVTVFATTGTVGNFGVTLFRQLLSIPVRMATRGYFYDPFLTLAGAQRSIPADACLFWTMTPNAAVSGPLQYTINFYEDT